MDTITVLDISFSFAEVEDVIHPVVLADDKNMILVDCGYTGFLPMIEQAMRENDLDCNKLTHVLITHQDHDHMGALSALKDKYPEIKVVASRKEAPYISGQLKSLRLEQAEKLQDSLPDDQKSFGMEFCRILRNVQPVEVDIEVEDGDLFDWCGGCTILATPGHTPGHISLYVHKNKVLIAGDAAVLENGNLVVANPHFALDLKEAEKSLEKIKTYGAREIVCYHGGVLERETILQYYIGLARKGTKESIGEIMKNLNEDMTIVESKFIDFALSHVEGEEGMGIMEDWRRLSEKERRKCQEDLKKNKGEIID